MQPAQIADSNANGGTHFTERELHWFRAVQNLIRSVGSTQEDFELVLGLLSADLQGLRQHAFSMDAAATSGFHSAVESFPKHATQSLAADSATPQRQFLNDVDGLLEFGIRNDLDFVRVVSMLAHDVNGIRNQYDSNLDKARAEFFVPMVSGWAKKNAMPIGEPEPSME